jgi:hypothetical protein
MKEYTKINHSIKSLEICTEVQFIAFIIKRKEKRAGIIVAADSGEWFLFVFYPCRG